MVRIRKRSATHHRPQLQTTHSPRPATWRGGRRSPPRGRPRMILPWRFGSWQRAEAYNEAGVGRIMSILVSDQKAQHAADAGPSPGSRGRPSCATPLQAHSCPRTPVTPRHWSQRQTRQRRLRLAGLVVGLVAGPCPHCAVQFATAFINKPFRRPASHDGVILSSWCRLWLEAGNSSSRGLVAIRTLKTLKCTFNTGTRLPSYTC